MGKPKEEAANTTKEDKQRKTSTIVLLSLAVFTFLFITTMIVTFWVKDAVPDTLIQYTLGAGGLEALLLAGIKVSKILTGEKKKKRRDYYYEDDFYEDEMEVFQHEIDNERYY